MHPDSAFEKELMINDERVQTHESHPCQVKHAETHVLVQNYDSASMFNNRDSMTVFVVELETSTIYHMQIIR